MEKNPTFVTGTKTTATPNRIALRMDEAAHALSISPRTLYSLIKAGEIKAAKLDRAVLIPVSEIESFLECRMADS